MYKVKIIGRSDTGPVLRNFWVNHFSEAEEQLKKVKKDYKSFNLSEIIIQGN